MAQWAEGALAQSLLGPKSSSNRSSVISKSSEDAAESLDEDEKNSANGIDTVFYIFDGFQTK